MLDKQIHIYSLDTSDFYNQSEQKLHDHMFLCYIHRYNLKNKLQKVTKLKEKSTDENAIIDYKQKINKYNQFIKKVNIK